jgi:uncharacterized protein (DUF1684 family)
VGTGSGELLDWRRQVSGIYARVRDLAVVDPAMAHASWRAERDLLFATHPQSPLGADDPRRTDGLPVAPYDRSLRWELEIEDAEPQDLVVGTGTDGDVAFQRIGLVRTPAGPLDVWWLTGYGGGVWLPVRDTSTDTYGGGRYLLDTVKGADLGGGEGGRRLVVDLNFLYNPSCAYDEAWACPLAPAGNRFDLDVPVGELYRG